MYIYSIKQNINKLSDFKDSDILLDELQTILMSQYEFHTHIHHGDICSNSTYEIFDETRIKDDINTYIELKKDKSYIQEASLYHELLSYMISMFDNMSSEVMKDDVFNMLENSYFDEYSNIIEDNKEEFDNIEYTGDVYKFYADNMAFFSKYKDNQ